MVGRGCGRVRGLDARLSDAPRDPLAVDYLLAGSRMGTRVLRRRWLESTDPAVHAADAYFGLPDDPSEWARVRGRLSEIADGSDRALRIEADVSALYALFHEAALAEAAARRDAA